MFSPRRLALLVILIALLTTLPLPPCWAAAPDCAAPEATAVSPSPSGGPLSRLVTRLRCRVHSTFGRTDNSRAPAEPAQAGTNGERPGWLLHTGAIQLGPWVGHNGWRWQGDGEGGF